MANFYLEVDNNFDSKQTAKTEREALEKLFPKAIDIDFIGADDEDGDDYSVWEVTTTNDNHRVIVRELN